MEQKERITAKPGGGRYELGLHAGMFIADQPQGYRLSGCL